MPGRSYEASTSSASVYRYGFNGQEKSDEIFEGSTTALFWEYDSRTGRRWNVDPKGNIWESPYATLGNSPISMMDPYGDIYIPPNGGGNPSPGNGGSSTRDNSSNNLQARIGTAAHTALSGIALANNEALGGRLKYITNLILPSGLKPDLIDSENKNVWELKPINHNPFIGSYRKYKKTRYQIENYVEEINQGRCPTQDGLYGKGGTWQQLPVLNGTRGYGFVDGKMYEFRYYISNPATGVIYYTQEEIHRKKEPQKKPETAPAPVTTPSPFTPYVPVFLPPPSYIFAPKPIPSGPLALRLNGFGGFRAGPNAAVNAAQFIYYSSTIIKEKKDHDQVMEEMSSPGNPVGWLVNKVVNKLKQNF